MVVPNLRMERRLWRLGYCLVAGVDEVGRGCFAGPVVAGAVIFSKGVTLPEGLADSKLLKVRQRERLAKEIKRVALSWSVSEIGVAKIDKLGIGRATQTAFRKAVRNLSPKPDYVLFDAFYNRFAKTPLSQSGDEGEARLQSSAALNCGADVNLLKKTAAFQAAEVYNLSTTRISSSAYIQHLNRKKQQAVKSGDKICASIAAASIVAKVYRDKLMKKLHRKYPQYGFARNKGYGTKIHQEAIKKYGLSKIHRKSFDLSKFV